MSNKRVRMLLKRGIRVTNKFKVVKYAEKITGNRGPL
jgi:hypothetical protein